MPADRSIEAGFKNGHFNGDALVLQGIFDDRRRCGSPGAVVPGHHQAEGVGLV